MTGVRARVRAELTAEIKAIARRQMAEDGPANLNLRAIARELGMVSSAIYRYFASRDDLLTALIVDAYNALGEAGEAADAAVDPHEVRARFLAVAHAAYRWACEKPSQYLLLFGTPVPGYAAPQDTIVPATRFTLVLLRILDEAARQGAVPAVRPTVPDGVRDDFRAMRELTGSGADDELMLAGMQSWTALFGAIGFILNGQFRNVIGDVDAMFVEFARLLAGQVFHEVDPA
ncbi:MAG: TetR/AcrR family transcriptional regulator [Actinobacteria bacterium]|nr:TetR/AcrR family transcriptional regulator [Actinomycetota bacterium]